MQTTEPQQPLNPSTPPRVARPPSPKLLARRQRIHAWRMRVTKFGLSAFVVAWVGIFGQLASGNDPALSSVGPARSTTAAEPASVGRSGAAVSLLADSANAYPAPPAPSAPAPTPLTTSQS